MKTIQIRVPETIHERMKKLAKEEGISMNNFIVSSVSNEVIRQETRDFFRRASADFNSELFAEALAAVPDKPVQKTDEMA